MVIHTVPPLPNPQLFERKKVAAYCRVSTEQEMQHHSLEVQAAYFDKFIGTHPNWTFAGIYSDEASSRDNRKMLSFQRMLFECQQGNIDLILVKSISRLGRNTVQFLQACDELNRLNVDVYFEVEKLHINDSKAVRMLTIYASLYQNESESKSYAIRWGNQTRFRNGQSKLYDRPCYGYRRDTDGHLEINEEEAENVRMIHRWRRLGLSLKEISDYLFLAGIKSPKGRDRWSLETIRRILSNEKYNGDVCLQKTYVADYFSGKRAVNRGELEQFLWESHHESIL